jgi:hypothetical protein
MLRGMTDGIGRDVAAGAAGAAGGLAATAAMTVVMVGARETGAMRELPPHEVANKAVDRTPAGRNVDASGRRALGWLLHLAFGGLVGAVYAVARRRLPVPGPPIVSGVAFALGVWAVSYLGWIPALRIMPPATDDEPGRPPAMILAHVVFGAVLGTIVERVAPRR